jgi:transcriptional regulator with XRE-family HTH domain
VKTDANAALDLAEQHQQEAVASLVRDYLKRGGTQKALADALGMAPTSISKLLNPDQRMTLTVPRLHALARAMNLPLSAVFSEMGLSLDDLIGSNEVAWRHLGALYANAKQLHPGDPVAIVTTVDGAVKDVGGQLIAPMIPPRHKDLMIAASRLADQQVDVLVALARTLMQSQAPNQKSRTCRVCAKPFLEGEGPASDDPLCWEHWIQWQPPRGSSYVGWAERL